MTQALLLTFACSEQGAVAPIYCDTGNEHQATYVYVNYLATPSANHFDRFPDCSLNLVQRMETGAITKFDVTLERPSLLEIYRDGIPTDQSTIDSEDHLVIVGLELVGTYVATSDFSAQLSFSADERADYF